jgi:hypothetical protein
MISLRIHRNPGSRTTRLSKIVFAAALRAGLCLASPISAAALPLIQPLDNASSCDEENDAYLRINMLAEELGDSADLLSDALASVREQLLDCLEAPENSQRRDFLRSQESSYRDIL